MLFLELGVPHEETVAEVTDSENPAEVERSREDGELPSKREFAGESTIGFIQRRIREIVANARDRERSR